MFSLITPNPYKNFIYRVLSTVEIKERNDEEPPTKKIKITKSNKRKRID